MLRKASVSETGTRGQREVTDCRLGRRNSQTAARKPKVAGTELGVGWGLGVRAGTSPREGEIKPSFASEGDGEKDKRNAPLAP